jgi:hypothetical protein
VDYAAPEQIEGKEVDGRADVYALGCVLYQCLTGSVVFVKDTEPQVMLAHVLETPLPPSARRSGLSPALDAVAAKALAKSRDDRYGGCVEFVAAAREALAAHPDPPVAIPEPAAPPAPAPEPEQAPPDPPPTGATRLAATPVIPAAEPPAPPAPPAAAPPPPPAPGPAAPAARARRPFRIPLTRKTGLIAVALVVVAIVGVVLATSGGGGGGPQLEVCELYAAGVCGTPGFERPGSTSRMVLVLHVSSSRPGETVEFDLTRGADTFTFFGNRLDPKTYVAPIFNQDSSGNAVPFGQESFGVRVKVAGKPVKVSPSTIVFH